MGSISGRLQSAVCSLQSLPICRSTGADSGRKSALALAASASALSRLPSISFSVCFCLFESQLKTILYNLRKIIKFNWSVAVAIMKLAASAVAAQQSALYARRTESELRKKQQQQHDHAICWLPDSNNKGAATTMMEQQQQQQQRDSREGGRKSCWGGGNNKNKLAHKTVEVKSRFSCLFYFSLSLSPPPSLSLSIALLPSDRFTFNSFFRIFLSSF